jgi:hypothetical protein
MLAVVPQHNLHFGSCQMPLNIIDAHFLSFGHKVLPKLVEQGLRVLGMKSKRFLGTANLFGLFATEPSFADESHARKLDRLPTAETPLQRL